MSAPAVMRQAVSRPADAGRPAREREIRRLALTNQTVAAAVGLVDNNGLPWLEAMECLVLELCAVAELPGRAEDRQCVACHRISCACPGGAA